MLKVINGESKEEERKRERKWNVQRMFRRVERGGQILKL